MNLSPAAGTRTAVVSRRPACTCRAAFTSNTHASSRSSSQGTSLDRRTVATILLPGLVAGSLAMQQQPAAAKVASGDWSSPGLATPEDEYAPKFFKTASGVKVQELAPGSGPTAQTGDFVLFDYVLRRANGYFIYGALQWLQQRQLSGAWHDCLSGVL